MVIYVVSFVCFCFVVFFFAGRVRDGSYLIYLVVFVCLFIYVLRETICFYNGSYDYACFFGMVISWWFCMYKISVF